MKLRVGRLLERSRANGPGERFVVWTQGCSLACPGCFNPDLWTRDGREMEIEDLARRILAVEELRGVTISGGEPLEQPEAVAELLSRVRPRLDAVLFSGYTLAEIKAQPARRMALAHADLLVAGRFTLALACQANPWAGSSDKTVHALTGRIRPEEFPDSRVEAFIGPEGTVTITGFPPENLRHA